MAVEWMTVLAAVCSIVASLMRVCRALDRLQVHFLLDFDLNISLRVCICYYHCHCRYCLYCPHPLQYLRTALYPAS
jgi:hypothetical protein